MATISNTAKIEVAIGLCIEETLRELGVMFYSPLTVNFNIKEHLYIVNIELSNNEDSSFIRYFEKFYYENYNVIGQIDELTQEKIENVTIQLTEYLLEFLKSRLSHVTFAKKEITFIYSHSTAHKVSCKKIFY